MVSVRDEFFFFIEKKTPTIVTSKSSEEINIFDECSQEEWNATEGALGNNAEIVIDLKCPIKLQEIQITNGIGDFSTKGFSIFGSQSSLGPWKRIFSGEMQKNRMEVRKSIMFQ